MEEGKILIVDDEPRIRKLVRNFLTREGYEVLEAGDGAEALHVFNTQHDLNLIILDVMMPKMNGYEVLKKIRETSKIPIIMLTAKTSEEDELQGFNLGVDEYIGKPFSPKILVARVNAVIRRGQTDNAGGNGEVLEAGGIRVDIGAHTASVDGKEIVLSVKEFELLTYFIQNKGIALSRDTILNNFWNYDYF